MFCQDCGASNEDGARFCQACGARLETAGAAALPTGPEPARGYAGFWLRLVAFLIDDLILMIPLGILFLALMAGEMGGRAGMYAPPSGGAAAVLIAPLFMLYAIVGVWLYFALFEFSARQATPGKMAAGIVVTDMEGKRISFGKASGRYWGKIISQLILYLGFMMAGWTQKKQALHDIMAGTLVVRKR